MVTTNSHSSGRETNSTYTRYTSNWSDAQTQSLDITRSPSDNIFIDNIDGIIDNPLVHWMPYEVDEYARQFAIDHGLSTLTGLFQKAGRVLQDPGAWETVRGLTDGEKIALASEVRSERHIIASLPKQNFFRIQAWKQLRSELFPPNGFWRQPKQMRVTTITLCVAAITQGWCQAGSNAANLNWAQELLGYLSRDQDCNGAWTWIFALVNAAPYLSASLIGCWLSDPLSERFAGRRVPIAISAIFILGAAIGSGCSQTWQQLLTCRLLLGFGMGCKAAVVPVYASEIAPAHLRGALVMNWQLFDAFGIFLGFSANLVATVAGASAWRWQLASAALPGLVLLGQIYQSPESPRLLMSLNKYPAAYRSLLSLRGEAIITAKELLYIHCQMDVEKRLLPFAPQDVESQRSKQWVLPTRWSIYARKLRLIFAKPRTRRAVTAAVVAMVGQQFCGVNVLEFYSSTLYERKGNSCGQAWQQDPAQHTRPLWLTWGVGLANFVFTLPAYWLIDRKGRRWLLLVTLPFMALSMLGAALSFKIDPEHPAYVWVIALFTYMFMFFYSWGMGPVPFTYSAEVFPLEVRMVGMSFSVFTNFLGAGLLALFVPAVTRTQMHNTGLLGLFTGFNVMAFVLVFLLFPETAGAAIATDPNHNLGGLSAMSLEELNYIFGVRTRIHMRYQFHVLRYNWNRYILQKGDLDPPVKLYKWLPHKQQELKDLADEAQERPMLNAQNGVN